MDKLLPVVDILQLVESAELLLCLAVDYQPWGGLVAFVQEDLVELEDCELQLEVLPLRLQDFTL